ncbi:Putative GTP cyclohydrolase URC1 [Cladobotryum mycophilum]|uniref:GTP cyclohydrolase URC1 n=1 Tax=Cladobotryum mycophilum TaxID=491253 RepID=A0ABR0SUI3_9HYPO
MSTDTDQDGVFLGILQEIQQTQAHLVAAVESLTDRVDSVAIDSLKSTNQSKALDNSLHSEERETFKPDAPATSGIQVPIGSNRNVQAPSTASPSQRSGLTSRIVLTWLPELEESVKSGRLVPDGKVCLNELGELAVTKFAVEPVWYLPGVAERFGIDEGTLRRSLFEHTGGSYPELITRGDIKVFLPPIGGLTVYCFGDPAKMSDESVRLSLRIHDECNGSDVFGSDICTCRPYLIFGIEEAVKEAQNGGSGVVIYFRKEGRALGEVTKYCKHSNFGLVYNARKRGADLASDYFQRTENIAGVKDMRFQALMPDILHWLGIKKIDRMLSMSNMKHDAIVGQGIPIHERVELPDELIPADSRVEIDAKITAGYFTAGKRLTADELKSVQGRLWEDIDH